ncbi:LORF2 protein, partial [Crocuta crocuta]
LYPSNCQKLKMSNNTCCQQGCGGKCALTYWSCKAFQPFWKAIWHYLLKIHIPLDPRILLLGIYSIKIKVLICKDMCARMFIAGLFVAAKNWKHGEWPLIREWLK